MNNLYSTYRNVDPDCIRKLLNTYIISDSYNYRQFVSFLYKLQDRPGLDYIVQVAKYMMAPLIKLKLKYNTCAKKDPVFNQLNLLGGPKSSVVINDEADFEATLKGMACKGASALDELFGTTKCGCDSVSGLLN